MGKEGEDMFYLRTWCVDVFNVRVGGEMMLGDGLGRLFRRWLADRGCRGLMGYALHRTASR